MKTKSELDDSERTVSENTEAAIEDLVGRNVISGRYLLLAVLLAVVWWKLVGAMSAWVAGFGLIILSFGAENALAALSSRNWPTTEGVVLESDVLTEREAQEYAGLGGSLDDAKEAAESLGIDADDLEGSDTMQGTGNTGYVPLVRYEFTVDGKRYETAKISPFDGTISRRPWASALVDQYPKNKHVTLRYDPDDPSRSYLRSWIRATTAIMPVVGVAFLAFATWFAIGAPGGAPVVPLGIGILIAALGLRRTIRGLRSRGWPTTTGVVTANGVTAKSGGGEGSGGKTGYFPEVAYDYEVDGTSYVSSRYAFGGSMPSFSSRSEARSWLEDNYPIDGDVTVHYDPDTPDLSVLKPGAGRTWTTVAVGLAFTALGVLMLLNPNSYVEYI